MVSPPRSDERGDRVVSALESPWRLADVLCDHLPARLTTTASDGLQRRPTVRPEFCYRQVVGRSTSDRKGTIAQCGRRLPRGQPILVPSRSQLASAFYAREREPAALGRPCCRRVRERSRCAPDVAPAA